MAAGVLVLMAGGVAVAHGSMTTGALLSFFVTLRILSQYGASVIEIAPTIVLGNQSLLALHQLLTSAAVEPYPGTAKIDFQGEIRLEDVSFRYRQAGGVERRQPVIQPRRTVSSTSVPTVAARAPFCTLFSASTGPTSAFSTAMDVPTTKSIFPLSVEPIGFVAQNPTLFSGSIRENISYGMPEATLEQIRQAASLASRMISSSSLPDGYDTTIGDDGVRLSGGQRQRIAIARALLRQPKLLVLDEPTNHLDIKAVTRLMENLRPLENQLALLLVSHDREVVRHADDVFEIDNGIALRMTTATV